MIVSCHSCAGGLNPGPLQEYVLLILEPDISPASCAASPRHMCVPASLCRYSESTAKVAPSLLVHHRNKYLQGTHLDQKHNRCLGNEMAIWE